jgi:polysaccharide biosynthesis transport protein
MADHHPAGAAASHSGSSVVPLSRREGPVQEYRDDTSRQLAFPNELPAGEGLGLPNLLRVLLKWRWLFLFVVLLCVLAGALSAYLTTPLYKARAVLELNPEPVKLVQMGDSVEPRTSDPDFLALQVGLMKSRAVAERVARRLNLNSNDRFLGGETAAPASQDAVVAALRDGFSASGTASSRLMEVTFVHPDPGIAAQVANGFAESFIESNLERQFDATAYSRKYLQQRLATTREKLETSEAQLMAYARQANILNIVSSEGASSSDAAGSSLAATNLMALNQQLAEAQNARIAAEQRYQQAGGASAAASLNNPVVQTLEQQRAQLRGEYQKGLQTFGPQHPQLVELQNQIDALGQQIAQAQSRTSSATSGALRADYVAAVNRERQLQGKIQQLQSQVMDLGDRSIQYNILKREVEANRNLYNALLQRLREEDTSATRSSSVSVVDTAKAPGSPFAPNVPRSITVALLLGLALGTSAAFGAEYLDDTVKAPEDMRTRLGLDLLGVVPKLEKGGDPSSALLEEGSSLSEAYYSIRTALQFSTSHGMPKTISFTSARAAEGKTTSAFAVAKALAALGINTILVDADLRNPSLLPEQRTQDGLVALLVGRVSLDRAIVAAGTPNLYLLPAGQIPPSPANLLGSDALRRVLADLAATFDVVIVDGPPVLGLADAPLIAAVCEATVMVCEAGKTRRRVALDAIARLRLGGANIVGGILTKFNHKALGYGYGYGYGAYAYTYGEDTGGKKAPRRRLTFRQTERLTDA